MFSSWHINLASVQLSVCSSILTQNGGWVSLVQKRLVKFTHGYHQRGIWLLVTAIGHSTLHAITRYIQHIIFLYLHIYFIPHELYVNTVQPNLINKRECNSSFLTEWVNMERKSYFENIKYIETAIIYRRELQLSSIKYNDNNLICKSIEENRFLQINFKML